MSEITCPICHMTGQHKLSCQNRVYESLESALASERAARTAAEVATRLAVKQATGFGLEAHTAEATIAQLREWESKPWSEDMGADCAELGTILAAAPSAALDAHDAQVKAEALEEFANWLRDCDDMDNGAEPNDGYWNGVYEDHARARAAEILKAAQ